MSTASATPYGRARQGSSDNSLPLVRLIALAAILFVFGSAPATAGPITCNPDVEGGSDTIFNIGFACETQSAVYSSENTSNTFFFGGGTHTNTLTFLDGVLETFTLSMSAFYVDPGDVQDRMPEGRVCEQYALPFPGACVYYRVEDLGLDSGPPQQGTHYTGNWEQEIVWFSVDPAGDAHVFHAKRNPDGTFGFSFDDNITVPGSYDPEPVPDFFPEFLFKDGDPLIKGATDNFSDTIVSPAQVPEPATLLLLGVGLGGMAYRKRRRIQDNGA